MKNLFRFFLATLFALPFYTNAQSSDSLACGVSRNDDALIKERMLANRKLYLNTEAHSENSESIFYIPVKITIVGDANGNGYIDIDKVLTMLCDLNAGYLSMGVQFYLKDGVNTFRYMNSNAVYNNAFSSSANNFMTNNKIGSCLNIYIGASVNNPVASFYSPSGDYVFMLDVMIKTGNKTALHEIGHFFSLPHTFYGWEGYNFSGTAPFTIGGVTVENVARTGTNTNCYVAGDGFCDTEADYISFRAPCPYISGGFDPLNVPINPDETQIMSYFNDNCVTNFSMEQADAVEADIMARGWTGFTLPTPNDTVTGSSIVSLNPNAGTVLPFGTNVTLSWNVTTNATAYVVEVKKLSVVFKQVVYDTTVVVPVSALAANSNYIWKVKPLNQYYSCGTYSTSSTFRLSGFVGMEDSQPLSFALTALTNPVASNSLAFTINSDRNVDCEISFYSIGGVKILQLPNSHFNEGVNDFAFDVSTASNGLYVLEIKSAFGVIREKVILNR